MSMMEGFIAERARVLRNLPHWREREAELKEEGARFANTPCMNAPRPYCRPEAFTESMAALSEVIPDPARWEVAYDPECDYLVLIRVAL